MSRTNQSIPLSSAFEQLYSSSNRFRNAPVNKRVLYLAVQAIANAVVIGFVARGLVALIMLITNLAFYGKFSFGAASPANNHLGGWVILVPVAGSVLVGFMARYGSKAIRGHGIPEAMEKIIMDDSKIPPAITFLKPLSAAISIGTGGPFGAEGPIIATGGAFGSLTGQAMHISSSERKIILTAGACAGMSAIFGSPLAALLLAIELLLFEFSPRSIIPVLLACITGAGMHLLLFENGPVFAMNKVSAPSAVSLLLYVLSGLLIGLIAALVSKSVYAVEDLFEKLPLHWMWWPAIGAVAVGIAGYYAPFTMGVGYENIQGLLNTPLPLKVLLGLCFLKYFSWVIALGSGTSGGTLAPLFTIGGATGALLAMAALHFFPALPIEITTAALVGMAAMFAGASRALLTSIVFALETTGQVNGLLPLMGACAAAYFVSFFLMEGTIMTEKIKRRGVEAPDSYEPDMLRLTQLDALISPLPEGRLDLPYLFVSDDAGLAAEIMGRYGCSSVLVLDNEKTRRPLGIVSAAAVLQLYSTQKQKGHAYGSPGRTRRLMVKGRKFIKKYRYNKNHPER